MVSIANADTGDYGGDVPVQPVCMESVTVTLPANLELSHHGTAAEPEEAATEEREAATVVRA